MSRFDEAADELYEVPPSGFVAARDAAAAEARAGGDRELATRLRGLRRPSATAWLVNELARTEPDLLRGLIAIGPALREATSAGDGAALRDLTTHRRALTADLVALGRERASATGQSFTPAIERELETTFTAATLDDDAAAAVSSRRLLASIEVVGVGFGPGAVPPPRVEPREDPAAPPPAQRPVGADADAPVDVVDPDVAAAEQALAVARLQQADAVAALEAAEAKMAAAVDAEKQAAAVLRAAKERVSDARADVTAAQADAEASRRTVEAALQRLGRSDD